MQIALWRRIALFTGLAGILVLSIIPVGYFSAGGGDKFGHFAAYFVLCFLFYLNRLSLGYAFIFSILYGVSLEFVQYFLSYRSFSFLDMGANSLGAGIFVLAGWINSRRKMGPGLNS